MIRDNGAGFYALMDEVAETLAADTKFHSQLIAAVTKAKNKLEDSVAYILENTSKNPKIEGAAATNFLMQIGYVCGGWYHLRSALIAQDKLDSGDGDSRFYENKILAAKFYIMQILPRGSAHGDAITDGVEIGCELNEKSF